MMTTVAATHGDEAGRERGRDGGRSQARLVIRPTRNEGVRTIPKRRPIPLQPGLCSHHHQQWWYLRRSRELVAVVHEEDGGAGGRMAPDRPERRSRLRGGGQGGPFPHPSSLLLDVRLVPAPRADDPSTFPTSWHDMASKILTGRSQRTLLELALKPGNGRSRSPTSATARLTWRARRCMCRL